MWNVALGPRPLATKGTQECGMRILQAQVFLRIRLRQTLWKKVIIILHSQFSILNLTKSPGVPKASTSPVVHSSPSILSSMPAATTSRKPPRCSSPTLLNGQWRHQPIIIHYPLSIFHCKRSTSALPPAASPPPCAPSCPRAVSS